MAKACRVCGEAVCSCSTVAKPATTQTRRWKICEWVSRGATCQVPTGTLGAEGEGGRLRPPRLCAYHRERERWSLYGSYQSEEQAFLKWVSVFKPGTSYQPLPRIWDLDRDTLWLLVSGHMTWEQFRAWMKGAPVA